MSRTQMILALSFFAQLLATHPVLAQSDFRRGDSDGDGQVLPLRDAYWLIQGLFVAGAPPPCLDALDVNDDGSVDIADAVDLLLWGFSAGSPIPPAPGPYTCGDDPTADSLGCGTYGTCLAPIGVPIDPLFEYRLPGLTGELGATATVSMQLDNSTEDELAGWSVGICHDSAVVQLVEVSIGTDVPLEPDFFEYQLEPDGVVVGVLTSLIGFDFLAPGLDLGILDFTYDLVGLGTSPLAHCDVIAGLTVANHVVTPWGLAAPIQIDGEISVVEPTLFRRGDTNGDGVFDVADPIFGVMYLFAAGAPPLCQDAGDSNDDGVLNISDAIHMLGLLFGVSTTTPTYWLGGACGVDQTTDSLDCAGPPVCP